MPRSDPAIAEVIARYRPRAVDEAVARFAREVTITVAPSINAKTAQRHDHLSDAWRRSFARRTAVERSNARIKDPATIDVARGWCRLMGHAPISLWLCCALLVRNFDVADAFCARQAEEHRRRSAGLGPRTRRRRRTTLAGLVGRRRTRRHSRWASRAKVARSSRCAPDGRCATDPVAPNARADTDRARHTPVRR